MRRKCGHRRSSKTTSNDRETAARALSARPDRIRLASPHPEKPSQSSLQNPLARARIRQTNASYQIEVHKRQSLLIPSIGRQPSKFFVCGFRQRQPIKRPNESRSPRCTRSSIRLTTVCLWGGSLSRRNFGNLEQMQLRRTERSEFCLKRGLPLNNFTA